ncbi:hypothetical protein PRJ39_02525 [Lysobacter enzymogenes]|uniref:hypothetical protein n=1 Tax=Lysobacter enzymogenes TaxID=69 RepID=UPI003749F907
MSVKSKASRLMVRKQFAIRLIAILAIVAFTCGCTSAAKTKPDQSRAVTVERLLTSPLAGIEARNNVKSAMMELYGIASADLKRIDNRSRILQDRHVLSMFWLEPEPVDFMSIAVAAAPCFPTEHAIRLTQAKLHTKERTPGAQTYDAIQNGVMVSFSTTPDEKCVSYIHIELDR